MAAGSSEAEVMPIEELLHEELRDACKSGELDSAKNLIEAGADVTAKDATGTDPLSYAAFHGHRDLAMLLLHHGASPENAVEEAERGGFLALAEYLRFRRAQEVRETEIAAVESARQREADVLARKARFQTQRMERERRKRGEKLAQQMQRAAEHRLLTDQKMEEAAARRAARQERQGEVRARRDEIALHEAARFEEEHERLQSRYALLKDVEAERERQLVESAVCPAGAPRPVCPPGASWGSGRPYLPQSAARAA